MEGEERKNAVKLESLIFFEVHFKLFFLCHEAVGLDVEALESA